MRTIEALALPFIILSVEEKKIVWHVVSSERYATQLLHGTRKKRERERTREKRERISNVRQQKRRTKTIAKLLPRGSGSWGRTEAGEAEVAKEERNS